MGEVFLIGIMCGDPESRLAVHFLGAQLHFDNSAVAREDRRMETLITVRLRKGDIVFDAAGKRTPDAVDHSKRPVAVRDRRDDDAHCRYIEHLFDLPVMLH